MDVSGIGAGSCEGGFDPHPSLKLFPYLAYSPWGPDNVLQVHTEDRKVSVETIGIDAAMLMNNEALASKHGTTVEHVRQAISYLSHILIDN